MPHGAQNPKPKQALNPELPIITSRFMTNAQITTSNIPVIESLRGIAASMVCLFHFTCGHHGFISNESVFKQVARNGWLGVEIFFVISGFVVPYSMYKNGYQLSHFPRFLLRRLLRLEPPYLLSIIGVLMLNYLAPFNSIYRGHNFVLNPIQISLHLGYLIAFFPGYIWLNPAYWTLAIEFQYYFILGLLFILINHRHLAFFWAGSLLLLLFSMLLPSERHFFHYSPYFMLGFCLFRKLERGLPALHFYTFSLLTFGLIFFQRGIGPFLASLLPFLLICFAPDWNPKPLKFLGMISYSMYLLHGSFAGRIIDYSAPFVVGDTLRIGIVMITFIVVCAMSYGFYLMIEKPSIAWSRRWKF